ncbi:MAG TPA: peptidylprolyl isomerase [Caulobacteraceae bacterium]|nr:peptidylprolyl isomerase [Caulobacteraceae bacterium]
MKVLFGLAALVLAAASVQAAEKPAPAAPAPLTPTEADWRTVNPDDILVIETNKGVIYVELAPIAAPAASAQLKKLARAHFYDGLNFFRVVDNFMDQTGDPKNDGTGQSKEPNLPPEFTFRLAHDASYSAVDFPGGSEGGFIGALPVISQPAAMGALTTDGKVEAYGLFCAGVIGIARNEAPDSGNSQFFLMRQDYQSLNRNYTPFGRVVVGEDVVRAIKVGEPVADPRDVMTKVYVLSDVPAAQRPKIRVVDTKSAYFHALVKRTRDTIGEKFTPCDVEVTGEIVK